MSEAGTTEVVETWVNTGRGRVKVYRGRGKDRERETVHGGKKIDVTVAERKRMQADVAVEAQDPFTNGTFALVSVAGGEADESILGNANALTDDDIVELWGQRADVFARRLADITNPVTAWRIVEIGATHEKANPGKTAAAAEKLQSLRPQEINEVEHLSSINAGSRGPGDPQPLPDMTVPQMSGGKPISV